MPSQSNPFKMVLIFAPLIVIPLLAVFGLPQLPPISASATPETPGQLPLNPLESDLGPGPQPQSGSQFPGTQAALPPSGDPFNGPSKTAQVTTTQSWQPPAESMQGWRVVSASNENQNPASQQGPREFRNFGEREEFSQTDLHQPPQTAPFQPPAARQPETQPPAQNFQPPAVPPQYAQQPAQPNPNGTAWQSARQRLKELGITTFHLTSSRNGRDFTFCCLYTPHDNPRITHRFEAEAPEPLQAVEKVLQQVEGWRTRQ